MKTKNKKGGKNRNEAPKYKSLTRFMAQESDVLAKKKKPLASNS